MKSFLKTFTVTYTLVTVIGLLISLLGLWALVAFGLSVVLFVYLFTNRSKSKLKQLPSPKSNSSQSWL